MINSSKLKWLILLLTLNINIHSAPRKEYNHIEVSACNSSSPGYANSCARMKSNAKRSARAWCSNSGGVQSSSFKCATEGTGPYFCRVTGHIECKGKPQRTGQWYGCSNCSTPKDREAELRKYTGGFSRKVPKLTGNATWNDLCKAMGKKCVGVVDWEGSRKGCNSWALDGSRAAKCK